MMPLVFRFLM